MALNPPPLSIDDTSSIVWKDWFRQAYTRLLLPISPTYTVATVPTAADYTGGVVFISDETGGAVLAFSDGTNWRRVTDRAIIS